MKPWDFEVREPADLLILADVLADWQHPGERVVRWMARTQRWPQAVQREGVEGDELHPNRTAYSWRIIYLGGARQGLCIISHQKAHQLGMNQRLVPGGTLQSARGRTYHHSITEAVWALVNAVLASGAEVPEGLASV